MKSPKSRFHLIGIFKPVISVLFLIFFITYNSHIYSQQKAFPTAIGAGAYATGGRGGQVIHVTNLNGSGEGSLLEAIRTTGARIIVFDVSGVITLDVGEWQNLISGSSYNDLTIAGQTAPEGGITIKCRDILVNEVDNIVIRYVRFRHYNQNYTRDAVNFQGCQNVIFDHVTASNGADECISFTTSASNRIPDKTTMQRCYLQDSKTGSIFGDNTSGGTNSTEFTIVNNLFQNISHRFSNPIGDGSRHDILNNVVYNWKRRLIRTTHSVDVNAINNYYKSAGGGTSTWYSNPVVDKICQQAQLQSGDTTKIYSAGNVVDVPSGDTGWSASTDDRAMWRVFTSSGIATPVGDLVPDSYFRVPYVAFDLVGEAYTIKTAVEAYADVLADVGANKYLNSDGSVSFWQDAKDTSAILEVTNDTYSEAWYDGSDWGYNTDEHIGTIPNNTRAGNYDTDGDGMADVWETTTFGDLTKTSAGDEDSDGYTNIEEFLNQVDGDQPNIPKITRIDSNPTTIEVGGTYAPPTGTWTDVEDISGTATVGGDIVDVNKIGTYNVTLEHTDTDGNRGYLPIPVYIVAPPVNAIGVTVTPETVSIEEGFPTQLSATVNGSGEDATDQTGDWTSDATNIATVEITSG